MSNLRILLANIMKLSEVCHSLLNNEKFKDFSFLLNIRVGSPHSALHHYMHWQPFFLSTLNFENTYNTTVFYSMI